MTTQREYRLTSGEWLKIIIATKAQAIDEAEKEHANNPCAFVMLETVPNHKHYAIRIWGQTPSTG